MGQEEFQPNRNVARRDALLFGAQASEDYSCRNFSGLGRGTFRALISERFLNPLESHNESPQYGEFLRFMEKHPQAKIFAIGYAIGLERSDYRISIEGLEGKELSDEALRDFDSSFSNADEFILDVANRKARCWYD